MNGLLAVAIAYLLGAIPFGYLVVKFSTGKDVRGAGSGNIGATNVLRTTGRRGSDHPGFGYRQRLRGGVDRLDADRK